MQLKLKFISDMFSDHPEQNVLIRDDVLVNQILTEIQREYHLPDGDYRLQVGETGKALDPNRTLAQQTVAENSALFFSLDKLSELNDPITAVLQLNKDYQQLRLRAENGQVFELTHFPALIGRPNPQSQLPATVLALDLTPLDPEKTSSRPHARISLSNNIFYIESLRGANPVYVNERSVSPGQLLALTAKDRLRFGKVVLYFEPSSGNR